MNYPVEHLNTTASATATASTICTGNQPQTIRSEQRLSTLTARAMNTFENMLQAWIRARRAQAQVHIDRSCYGQACQY